MALKPAPFIKKVCSIGHNVYYDTLGEPLQLLREIVREYDFDVTALDGIYCGEDGVCTFEVHPKFDIRFIWHKMPSGRFEIVCYTT